MFLESPVHLTHSSQSSILRNPLKQEKEIPLKTGFSGLAIIETRSCRPTVFQSSKLKLVFYSLSSSFSKRFLRGFVSSGASSWSEDRRVKDDNDSLIPERCGQTLSIKRDSMGAFFLSLIDSMRNGVHDCSNDCSTSKESIPRCCNDSAPRSSRWRFHLCSLLVLSTN